MKRLAINAISIKEGGSVVVLEKLIKEFLRSKQDIHILVVTNTRLTSPEVLENPRVQTVYFQWAERVGILTIIWYLIWLPIWLVFRRVEILFSMTNYLPLFAPCKTALLVQHAGHFCRNFFIASDRSMMSRIAWRMKSFWVHYSIRIANRVTLQTEAFKNLVINKIPSISGKITVIPHGPGYLEGPQSIKVHEPSDGKPVKILYCTTFGVQKNFDVILDALNVVNKRNNILQLHLTLDENIKEVRDLMQKIGKRGLDSQVVNHKDLNRNELSDLFQSSDLFVYSSVCESFGFPMLEAMAFGLPIVAADTPGNREICSFAAVYFPPKDENSLAELLEQLTNDRNRLLLMSEKSIKQVSCYNWVKSGAETLSWLMES